MGLAACVKAGLEEIAWDIFGPTAAEIGGVIDRIAEETVPVAAAWSPDQGGSRDTYGW